jgi:hypothetical protein
LCPPPLLAQEQGPLLPKLRGYFAEFLQHRSLKRLGILYQSTSVGFGYGLSAGAISWKIVTCHSNPIRSDKLEPSSRTAGWGILTPFPSATAVALALGARLTLRGLTLRRNPWTFGVRVSHPHLRYSCQHSHFRYLQQRSHVTFTGLRNAPLPRACAHPQLRCVALAPLHFRRRIAVRPVSYYAFFKGWLLLSQPPGCLGRPTSFPT